MTRLQLQDDLADQARLLAVLGNVNRLKIILMLRAGEVRVGHMSTALGLTIGGVSQHLSLMREAGIVTSRRVGQNVYCRLISEDAADLIAFAMAYAAART